MTARERNLAILLIGLILLGGGGAAGYLFAYQPIQEKKAAAAALDTEIGKLKAKMAQVKKDRVRLGEAKKRSLPANPELAQREYEGMMSRLLLQAKVPPGFRVQAANPDTNGTPMLGPKKPAYTRVAYKITFDKADMWAVHDFLTAYYRLDLLHQITALEIKADAAQAAAPGSRGKPTNTRNDLAVTLTTEAIILDGAENRRTLLPVPTGFAAAGGFAAFDSVFLTPEAGRGLTPLQLTPVLSPKNRDYTLIVQNDIFHGPLPPPPSMQFEKIADLVAELGKPIPPIKLRLTGDLGLSGKVVLDAKPEGKLLPTGAVTVDQAKHVITITPPKGVAGKEKVTVVARNEEGKEAKATFAVEITDPSASAAKLPDISESIRLVIATTRSDGTAGAVIKDNFNPLTYEVEVTQTGRVKVSKFDHFGARKKEDKTYRIDNPGLLVLSDDGVSSTNRTFKVVAIDSDGLIVEDLKPEPAKPAPPAPKGGGFPPRNRMGLPPADPLAVVSGAAAAVVKKAGPATPVLYRWACGKSLKALAEVPKDEAKKIIQRVAETGPVGAVAAGGH